jgi:hypothetical protein
MNIIFRGLELHQTYVPEKEGVDKKGAKNNISMKRFNLTLKPLMWRIW